MNLNFNLHGIRCNRHHLPFRKQSGFCQDMDLDLFVVKSESQKQRLANSTGHMFKSWCQTLCLNVCYGCLFVICVSFVGLLVFFE